MNGRRSFSQVDNAITHDSDPKYLAFEEYIGNSNAGEGTVAFKYIKEAICKSLKSSVAVPGPTINDLIGGDGNFVNTRLQPHFVNDRLQSGALSVTFDKTTIVPDDASTGTQTATFRMPVRNAMPESLTQGKVTLVFYDGTGVVLTTDYLLTQLQADAIATNTQRSIAAEIPTSVDLSTIIGKEIVRVVATTTTTYKDVYNAPFGYLNPATSVFDWKIREGSGADTDIGSHSLSYGGTVNNTTIDYTITANTIFALEFNLISDIPYPTPNTVNHGRITIAAYEGPTLLSTHDYYTSNIHNDALDAGTDLVHQAIMPAKRANLNSWSGHTITKLVFTVADPFYQSPDTLGKANSSFTWGWRSTPASDTNWLGVHTLADTGTLTVDGLSIAVGATSQLMLNYDYEMKMLEYTSTLTALNFIAAADAAGRGTSYSGLIDLTYDVSAYKGMQVTECLLTNTVPWEFGAKTYDSESWFAWSIKRGIQTYSFCAISLPDSASFQMSRDWTFQAGDVLRLEFYLKETGNTVGPFSITDDIIVGTATNSNANMDRFFSSDVNGSGFVTPWGDLSDLNNAWLCGIDVTVIEAFGGDAICDILPDQKILITFNGPAKTLGQAIGTLKTPGSIHYSIDSSDGIVTLPADVDIFITSVYGGDNLAGWTVLDPTIVEYITLMNSTSVKGWFSGEQLATQHATSEPINAILDYYGFSGYNFEYNSNTAYEPTYLAANSNIQLIMIGIHEYEEDEYLSRWGWPLTSTPVVVGNNYPSDDWVISKYTQRGLAMMVNVGPVYTYDNYFMTEPYEMRNRNRPAFMFKAYGPGIGEGTPVLHVNCWVSQGSPTGDNADRLWTLCPVQLVNGNTADTLVESPFTVDPLLIASGYPDNYLAPIILIPDAYRGPFNYVKFEVWFSDEDIAALSTQTLRCVANAREL